MVVNLDAQRTADQVATEIGQNQLMTAFAASGGTIGGLFAADWVANRFLPMLGLGTSPDSIMDMLGLVGAKGGTAAAATYGASKTGGIAQVGLAFVAIGALASAGIDVIRTFTDMPSLAQYGGGGNTATVRRTPSVKRSRSTTASSPSTPSGGQQVAAHNQF